jgi:hypothetical protein
VRTLLSQKIATVSLNCINMLVYVAEP